MASNNIRVFKNRDGNIIVRVNGLEVSAEAFEATHAAEYGLTEQEAKAVMAKVDALIPDND